MIQSHYCNACGNAKLFDLMEKNGVFTNYRSEPAYNACFYKGNPNAQITQVYCGTCGISFHPNSI